MKISDQFYKILAVIIKNKTNAIIGRPKTYNIEHYCKVIMKVLITGCQWNMLDDNLHEYFGCIHPKYLALLGTYRCNNLLNGAN